MTTEKRDEIKKIAMEFAKPFYKTFGGINGTGWLIVDPLSAFLSSIGIDNTLMELPETEKHPQVLIMKFPDGDKFIPAGGDLKCVSEEMENWQWL